MPPIHWTALHPREQAFVASLPSYRAVLAWCAAHYADLTSVEILGARHRIPRPCASETNWADADPDLQAFGMSIRKRDGARAFATWCLVHRVLLPFEAMESGEVSVEVEPPPSARALAPVPAPATPMTPVSLWEAYDVVA